MADINKTNEDVYRNGILSKLTDAEFYFIRDNQYDDRVNAPPSLINLRGSDIRPYPSYALDRPFKHIMPVISGNEIVGFGWKTIALGPDTNKPTTEANRASISTSVTSEAIRRANLPPSNPEHITKREAMFIIRARVGMERCSVPISQIPVNATNEDLARIDARRNAERNTQDKFGHYGTPGKSTSFNSDVGGDSSLRSQIKIHDAGRKCIDAANEWTREYTNDLKKPEGNRNIVETYDVSGIPVYIKKDPNAKNPDEEWKPFYPNFQNPLQNLSESERTRAADEMGFIMGGRSTRNPNDNTVRPTGKFIAIMQLATNAKNSPQSYEKQTDPDKYANYKTTKTIVQNGVYPAIVGAVISVAFLKKYGVITNKGHQLHHVLEAIELVATSVKTGKSLQGTAVDNDKWFDLLRSPVMPLFWFGVGFAINRLATGLAIGTWAGPVITCIVIVAEYVADYVISEIQKQQLINEAKNNGLLPGPYFHSKGKIRIPTKRGRMPIGRDSNGKLIYAGNLNTTNTPTKPDSDTQPGDVIPGEPPSTADLQPYNSLTDNSISNQIATNEQKNDNSNREAEFIKAGNENKKHGFNEMSANNTQRTESQPEGPRQRGGQGEGDTEDRRSPLERITDADPFGDWSISSAFNFLERMSDPIGIMYGAPGHGSSWMEGSNFIDTGKLPSVTTLQIQNFQESYEEFYQEVWEPWEADERGIPSRGTNFP
jgi:hypothetical protein